ncbi:MAG: hypothetical protein KDE45_24355 [Caldilineaceae bacterium]|nr:hypothetical protein [Caldilineaceae bacterium]
MLGFGTLVLHGCQSLRALQFQLPRLFVGGALCRTVRQAGIDEGLLYFAQFFAALAGPLFGLAKQEAAQQRIRFAAAGRPLLNIGAQALLPTAKLAILVHPLAQPVPVADQCLMD